MKSLSDLVNPAESLFYVAVGGKHEKTCFDVTVTCFMYGAG